MQRDILFVCLGNICRSPAAEAVFRERAPAGMRIDSAGTGGWHAGEPPYAPMQAAAAARGYDLASLRARQFTAADFDRFGHLIAMDDKNRADMERLRPAGNDTPIRLLMDFAPDLGIEHVPDPYYTRDFNGALDLIEEAVQGLISAVALDGVQA